MTHFYPILRLLYFTFFIGISSVYGQNCCTALYFNILTPKGGAITDSSVDYKVNVFTQKTQNEFQNKEIITFKTNNLGHKCKKSFSYESNECNWKTKIVIKKGKRKMTLNILHLVGNQCEQYNIEAIPFKKGNYTIDLTTQILSEQYSWQLLPYIEIPFHTEFPNFSTIINAETNAKNLNKKLNNQFNHQQCISNVCRKIIEIETADLPNGKAFCYTKDYKLQYVIWNIQGKNYQLYFDEKQNFIDIKGENPKDFPLETAIQFLKTKF